MMVALDDSSPLSQQEEDGKSDFAATDRADETEITIELYQHNKASGSKHTHNMALGSEDASAWDWLFRCFGCIRKGKSGSNFERIHLGEKQKFVNSKMSDSRGGGRVPSSPRNSFSGKNDRS